MSKKPRKQDVVLKVAYGVGRKAKRPGDTVSLPEEEAAALLDAGHAILPGGAVAAAPPLQLRIEELERALEDARAKALRLEGERKTACDELAAFREESEAKLAEAQAYALSLEEKCRAAGLSLDDTPEKADA